MSSKFKITVRKSKDPAIVEYVAVIWRDGKVVTSTDYHMERQEARAEAKELIVLIQARETKNEQTGT